MHCIRTLFLFPFYAKIFRLFPLFFPHGDSHGVTQRRHTKSSSFRLVYVHSSRNDSSEYCFPDCLDISLSYVGHWTRRDTSIETHAGTTNLARALRLEPMFECSLVLCVFWTTQCRDGSLCRIESFIVHVVCSLLYLCVVAYLGMLDVVALSRVAFFCGLVEFFIYAEILFQIISVENTTSMKLSQTKRILGTQKRSPLFFWVGVTGNLLEEFIPLSGLNSSKV